MSTVTLDLVEQLEDEWRVAHLKARASGPHSSAWKAEGAVFERLCDAKIELGLCCEPECRVDAGDFAYCKGHQP